MKASPWFCKHRIEPLGSEEFTGDAAAEMVDFPFDIEGGMFWDEIDWLWDCGQEWDGDPPLQSGMGDSLLH